MISESKSALLADMRSRNGTLINQKKLTPNKYVMLREGDVIEFSDYPFTFTFTKSVDSSKSVDIIANRTRSRSASIDEANLSKKKGKKSKSSSQLFDAFTGDTASKQKFMKLMGAKKEGSEEDSSENGNSSSKLAQKSMNKVNSALEKQYQSSITRKSKSTRGLGF